MLATGEEGVLRQAYEQVIDRSAAFRGLDYETWWIKGYSMLANFDREILRNLIHGRVFAEYKNNAAFRGKMRTLKTQHNQMAYTDKVKKRNNCRAGIYANIFGFANGESFSAQQMDEVANEMEKYQNLDSIYAGELDEAIQKWRQARTRVGTKIKPWVRSMTSAYKRFISGDVRSTCSIMIMSCF